MNTKELLSMVRYDFIPLQKAKFRDVVVFSLERVLKKVYHNGVFKS